MYVYRSKLMLFVVMIGALIIFAGWVIVSRQYPESSPRSVPADLSRAASGLDGVGPASIGTQDTASDADRLMRRYTFETELDKRGALLAALRSAPTREVKFFALRLAAGNDPAARQDGLALLAAFPLDDAQVRDFLVGQINEEKDPAMLKKLVDMLTPTMVPTEDAAPLVEQLARLRSNPDPEVRAASVLQSSQWNKGSDLEDILHQAMMDPDARVRQAAIGGITSEHVHSDRLKDLLLAIAFDPETSNEERHGAIFALEGFALNRSEYQLFRQAVDLAKSNEAPEMITH